MKALSLTQPWASLVAIGAKRIETRSWGTRYRGPLAIHASKGFPKWAQETCDEKPFYGVLIKAGLLWPMGDETLTHRAVERYLTMPLGAFVAVATLNDVGLITPGGRVFLGASGTKCVADDELAFGDYTPGRWAWLLADVKRLPEPIPCKGALGLWTVSDDIARQLEAL
jgi:hypothetical protein